MIRKVLPYLILCFLWSCSEGPQRVVDGDPEPPMPGFFERNFTWHGVDSDKDGVIDDVEIWINNNIKDPNLRKAYKQFTHDMMIALANIDAKEVSKKKSFRMLESSRCVSYFRDVLFDSLSEVSDLHYSYRSQLFPTINYQREERSRRSSRNFSGTIIESKLRGADEWQHCRFKISNREYYEKLMLKKFPGAFDKPLK